MPFFEQSPLHDQLDFTLDVEARLSTLGYGRTPIGPLLCPSDSTQFQVTNGPYNYAGSIGNQRMSGRSCAVYPGNDFGTGPTGHGSTENGMSISGIFSGYSFAARMADITDGTSNVIAMGECLPQHSNWQLNGWFWHDFPCAGTGWPINEPVFNPAWESAVTVTDLGCPGCNCPAGSRSRGSITSTAFRSSHPGGANFVACDGSVHFISETVDYITYQRLGDKSDGSPTGF